VLLSVVNAPAAGVMLPIGVLSIVPPESVGLFPKAGSAPVTPRSICPVVPAAVWLIAAVVSPINTPCAVNEARPVPPLDTAIGVVAVSVVKAPAAGVVCPIGDPLIDPPVIVGEPPKAGSAAAPAEISI